MSMPESKTRSELEKYASKEKWSKIFRSPDGLVPENGRTSEYEKPVFEKESGLTFPREIIEAFNGGRMCVQCSSCHGCH